MLASVTAPTPGATSTQLDPGVTLRVVALCLALAFALGYIIPVIDYKLFNTFLGATHLPPGAVGVLLVLVLVINPLLRLLSRRLAFSRNEALTVYITCLFSAVVPGHGAENLIIPVLIAPFYYATRENRWLNWIEPYLKPWLSPGLNPRTGHYDKAIVEGWYVGLRPGQSIPWGAWLVPLVVWGSVIMAMYIMLGCLSIMLRAQWAEHEALSFPLLRLPLEMTEGSVGGREYGCMGVARAERPHSPTPILPPFFTSRVMWVGFGITVFIQGLRGLHLYFPDVPDFPLQLDLNGFFSDAPWNQIGWVPIRIFPIAVGITYLLTSEVSFSLWFFYWFMKLQLLVAYYLGFMPNTLPDATNAFPGKSFEGFQTGGAYLAYVAIVLWTGREHFRHVVRRAFGRTAAKPDERREALSYPVAFWGFGLSFVYITGFTVVAGVRLDIALALWVSYLIFAIGLTRIAVEGGMLFLLHDIMPLGAISKLLSAGPTTWLTAESGLVPASFVQAGLIYHMRGFSMPSYVHGFKLAHDHKIAAKPLLGLLAAVVVISTCMSLWMVVHLGYDHGGLGLANDWSHGHLALRPLTFIDSVTKPTNNSPLVNWAALLTGALLTYGMMLARSRFIGFPFHPIAYLICLTFAAHMFWFSILLGWLAKTLITHFGGPDTYRKTVPLFLGLALGDVTMILFWLAIDGWQGRTGHLLMPY